MVPMEVLKASFFKGLVIFVPFYHGWLTTHNTKLLSD